MAKRDRPLFTFEGGKTLLEILRKILWPIFGYSSLLDNRFMVHFAGGYVVCHVASLFFKSHYWIAAIMVALLKETCDHWVFGCGSNEIKHIWDILGWSTGGISYYAIVLLKRRKFGWK